MIGLIIIFFTLNFISQLENHNLGVIYHGSRKDKYITLTFDACPVKRRGGFDKNIVTTLIDSTVPATFFLSGKWIQKHKSETSFLASVPIFEIGNHSYSHPHCCKIIRDSLKQELLLTEKLIEEITGKSTKLFRPKYGEIDTSIIQTAQNLGFTTVLYDVVSGDPDSTISSEAMYRYVYSKTRNGSIIIMHVNGRGWNTAKALPKIINSLRKQGFIFTTVSKLIKHIKDY